ncbi:MAG: hypothetical protein PHX84_01905 [Candidatus Shapirobacteria bacterium]|nr:hypothetical protein [Candidatus Shapirobacteria bacterium]
MKKNKIIILVTLLLIIITNLYISLKHPDIYTVSKSELSSLKGSTSYLGRLHLWRLLVQNNDWDNATTLESKLNPDQVKDYKLSYQPQLLLDKLILLSGLDNKNSDDYLQLAKIQSILGYSSQAIDSVKKAHQLDPIRSDIERLFYQVN